MMQNNETLAVHAAHLANTIKYPTIPRHKTQITVSVSGNDSVSESTARHNGTVTSCRDGLGWDGPAGTEGERAGERYSSEKREVGFKIIRGTRGESSNSRERIHKRDIGFPNYRLLPRNWF